MIGRQMDARVSLRTLVATWAPIVGTHPRDDADRLVQTALMLKTLGRIL